MFVGGRGKNNNNNNNSVNNLNNNSNNTRIPSDKLDFLLAQHSKQAASSTSTSSGLKQYTWKSLNEEISTSQRILVVGNGKYVYDATQWIHSHPGGKVILYSVSGTDISMDYFMEAGYDAAQFVPAPLRPTRSYAVADVPMYSGGEGNIIPDSNITTTSEDAVAYAMQNASYLTQEDWILVEKSRRTHIHSRLALERLSKILVGEIVADHRDTVVSSSSSNGLRPDQMTVAAVDGVPFDAFEYRRYTLTEKVLLTDDGKANVAIWKIKFTALYPYGKVGEGREGR